MQRGADKGLAQVANSTVARHFQCGHCSKAAYPADIFLQKEFCGRLAPQFAFPAHPASQHDASGHSFHVPFPWASLGLVEIIDIQHNIRPGSSEEAKIFEMSITAELDLNARV